MYTQGLDQLGRSELHVSAAESAALEAQFQAKVDREETFHLRHGEKWMRAFASNPERKGELQRKARTRSTTRGRSSTTSATWVITRNCLPPRTSPGRRRASMRAR